MKPFLLVLTLDPRDPRVGVDAAPWKDETNIVVARGARGRIRVRHVPARLTALPLFYCWSCLPTTLQYRLNPRGGVDVLDHDPSDVPDGGNSLPGELTLEVPARPMKLVPLTSVEQHLLQLHNRDRLPTRGDSSQHRRNLFIPRHQLRGEPYLVQKTPEGLAGRCDKCRGPRRHLAAIGDDSGTAKGFVGNAFLQLLFGYCAKCQLVDAHHECD